MNTKAIAPPVTRYDLGRVVQNFAKYRGISLTRVNPIKLAVDVDYALYSIATAFKAKEIDVFKGETDGLRLSYVGCMSPEGLDCGKYQDFSLKEKFLLQSSTRKITGFRNNHYNQVNLTDYSFDNLLKRFVESSFDYKLFSRSSCEPTEYKFNFLPNKEGLSCLETFLRVMAQ